MLEGLWLVHPDEAMCAAFHQRFAGLPNVHIIKGRFEDLEPHDCFVTAGNAFGLMTAGIDAAVVGRFGVALMQQVQHRIMDEFFGEQPVGTRSYFPQVTRRCRTSVMHQRCACRAASKAPTKYTRQRGPRC